MCTKTIKYQKNFADFHQEWSFILSMFFLSIQIGENDTIIILNISQWTDGWESIDFLFFDTIVQKERRSFGIYIYNTDSTALRQTNSSENKIEERECVNQYSYIENQELVFAFHSWNRSLVLIWRFLSKHIR